MQKRRSLLVPLLLVLLCSAVVAVLRWTDTSALFGQQPSYQEQLAVVEARLLPVLTQSGDLEMIVAGQASIRSQVEALIRAKNPKAVPRIKPELDRIFDSESTRAIVVQAFARRFFRGGIEHAEAWAARPPMVAINAVLLRPGEASAPTSASVLPERRAKLIRLAHATQLADRFIEPLRGSYTLAQATMQAMDPLFQTDPLAFRSVPRIDPMQLVDGWLAPALGHVPDSEIDEFLQFAESEAGHAYFDTVASMQGFSLVPWRQELLAPRGQELFAAIKTHAELEPADETESLADLKEQAKHLMYVVNTNRVLPEAKNLLLRAERLAPNDAEVQTMLGQVATHLRIAPQPTRQQLRVPGPQGAFEEAERHLRRAIELDPTAARAYSLLGRAKFLQSQDDEAKELFAEAQKLDPDQAWLRVNLADLASVQGRFDEAIGLYREAIERPQLEAGVHFWALLRSRIAFQQAGRLDEYSALGKKYMKEHPEDRDYPYEFAEHLLEMGTEDAEALDVLERSDPRRNPPRRLNLMAKALVGMAHASFERSGSLDAQARQWVARAVESSNGSETGLIDELAMDPARIDPMMTVVRASSEPESVATAVLRFALRAKRADMLDELASAGADLNAPVASMEAPLVMAMLTRDIAVFRRLLELGADPDRARLHGKPIKDVLQRDAGNNPLMAEMLALISSR